jgi:hypothetical protein
MNRTQLYRTYKLRALLALILCAWPFCVIAVEPFLFYPIPEAQAYEGQSISLTPTWRGDAVGYTFQWKKDGVALAGETTSTLEISPFLQNKAGLYTLTATNGGTTETVPVRVGLRSQVKLAVDYFQLREPAHITHGVVRMSGNSYSGAVVKADGSTQTWGDLITPPASVGPVADMALDWSNYATWLFADGLVGVSGRGFSYWADPFRLIPGVTDAVAVVPGYILRRNGTVSTYSYELQSSIVVDTPTSRRTLPKGLHGVTALAQGGQHMVALLQDSTVVCWGENYQNQCKVPPGLAGVVAVCAGDSSSAALKSDGTLVQWGKGPPPPLAPPGQHYVALARTGLAAITSAGVLVPWNDDSYGGDNLPNLLTWNPNIMQPLLPVLAADHAGWIVLSATEPGGQPLLTTLPEILGGRGYPFYFQITAKNRPQSYGAVGLPSGLSLNTATGVISGTIQQSGGFQITLSATTAAGATATKPLFLTVLDKQITTQPEGRVFRQPENHTLTVAMSGTGPFTYQWQRNGQNIPGALAASLALTPVTPSLAGKYQCLVTNASGTLASAEASLEFISVAAAWGGGFELQHSPPSDVTALRSLSLSAGIVGGLRLDRSPVWWWPGL